MKLIKAVNHPAGGGNPSLAMKIAKNHEGMCKGQGWDGRKKISSSYISSYINRNIGCGLALTILF